MIKKGKPNQVDYVIYHTFMFITAMTNLKKDALGGRGDKLIYYNVYYALVDTLKFYTKNFKDI